jgi:hypothetical protein
MASPLFRILVPDAPLHRRTESDAPVARASGARVAAVRRVVPGLQSPALVSSYAGTIERILFCFPAAMVDDPVLAAGYESVIAALRPGTRFVVAHNEPARPVVEQWFERAGHDAGDVEYVPLPDHVSLTDWAEDGYVSLKDGVDGLGYLMEPWEFPRAGDALIADAVEEYTDLRASGSPLIFQGGNCLVGGDFWLLGKDYFADTIDLITGARPPVIVPPQVDADEFARTLFRTYVDAERRLVVLGTEKAIPLRQYVGARDDAGGYLLDVAAEGAGTFQPIFHIDMFVTLVGPRAADGRFEVLVGSPRLGDERLGTTSPHALPAVYDRIAAQLEKLGFVVTRNPLVHRPTPGGRLTLGRLKELATGADADRVALARAVSELTAAGARDDSDVQVRNWHHVTWNNCLVERSATAGDHVYLPTYGHGDNADLEVIDDEMQALWRERGFTVHALGDFNAFAARQGVVHCIKKYVTRGG